MNIPSLIIMLACLIMSGYFSATETAFSTMNKTRMKTLIEKGNKRAELAYNMSERYDRLISTVLIGNNIVNILLSSLATVLFIDLLQSNDLGTTVSTVVTTIVVLIFGEITPKNIAKARPEQFAMFSAPLLRVITWIFMPFNVIFSGWRTLIVKLFKLETDNKMSQEELLTFVDEVQQEGTIDHSEGNLLRNAIEFTDLEANDILTHRVDLVAFAKDASKEEIAKLFSETQFSRLLVYEENIDNIVGVLHQKDFYTERGITGRKIADIISAPVFIHKGEKISDLLRRLQKEKSHIAVVLDEYGGTLGIVTMEDILEELVGEIYDEHDEVVEQFQKLDDNKYRVDCTVSLDDFSRFFRINTDDSESVSLGGWLTEQLDKIPDQGDSFQYDSISVTVVDADAHRSNFVEVVQLLPPDPDESADQDEEK